MWSKLGKNTRRYSFLAVCVTRSISLAGQGRAGINFQEWHNFLRVRKVVEFLLNLQFGKQLILMSTTRTFKIFALLLRYLVYFKYFSTKH